MLTVSQLFIHPIKSLGGMAVSSAIVTDRGFAYDRRWMLVDEKNHFLTQRTFHQMALFQTALTPHGLLVTYRPTGDSIAIPFTPLTDETTIAQIWDDQCLVEFVSPGADTWFSQKLSMHCRLVFMPDHSLRNVEAAYTKNNDLTSLSDGFPFLMIGQASLDDLNRRLEQPVPINRFRPNIVFTGGTPYQEDGMDCFSINNIKLLCVKPCGRCVVTTINQDNGIKGKEPLQTLATYRTQNNKINFGQNVLANGAGLISIGDTIRLG